jgi:hypothetical protein
MYKIYIKLWIKVTTNKQEYIKLVKKDDGIYNDVSEHTGVKEENVSISPFSVSQNSKVFKTISRVNMGKVTSKVESCQ